MNRQRTLLAAAFGAALLAGGLTYAALPADAAATADVQFSRIDYNSPGVDNRSNVSLVAEYVRLTNRSPFAVNINKWTLKDKAGRTFTFPSYVVGAHKTVYLHTGKGKNGFYPAGTVNHPHFYWQSGTYIWNNTGDTATLRSASGRVYDTCSWKSGGATTYCGYKAPGPLPPTTKPATTQPATTKPATTKPSTAPTTAPAPTSVTVDPDLPPQKPEPTGPIGSPRCCTPPPTDMPVPLPTVPDLDPADI
jgi:hypothetical protein